MTAASYTTLIDPQALAEHLHQPDWRIVDCRHDLANLEFGRQAYATGHLPGAHFLHLDEDLSGPKTGRNGRHPLPDPAQLVARLEACGIGNHTQVIAYDDAGGMFASRLWWMLRWLGHHRVAVLDGGFQAWRAGVGLIEDTPPPKAGPTVYSISLQPCRIDAEQLQAALGKPELLIIDARSPDRFRGENESLDPVGGHIPGARNRFFRDNLGTDGRFKPASELRTEFLSVLNGHAPEQVVNQCGSGVTACHNLLAMEVAGLPGARLYPGSWSEWCSDPARPVATGPA